MQNSQTAPISEPNQELITKLKPTVVIKSQKEGFSILDFLVILSAFFVIAFLGYLVLNPDKEGADNRNVHRSADVAFILSSVYSYTDQYNEIPETIPIGNECVNIGNEICKIGPYDCKGLVDLSVLSGEEDDKVLSIPSDPLNKSVNGTGYYITQDGKGNITVCAPYSERNTDISFSKYVF